MRVLYLPPAAIDGRVGLHEDDHEHRDEGVDEHEDARVGGREEGIGGSAVLIHHSTVLVRVLRSLDGSALTICLIV